MIKILFSLVWVIPSISMIDGLGNFPKGERKNFKHRQYLQSSSYDTIIHTWISNKFSSICYKHILIYRKYESWNLNHYIFNFHNLFVKYELCYGLWITLYRHDFYVQSFVAKNMFLISHVWYEQSSKTHTKTVFQEVIYKQWNALFVFDTKRVNLKMIFIVERHKEDW